jgi:NAD-dependent deacetylase
MQINFLKSRLAEASEIIYTSKYTVAFTGAGISVESGIPSFRGKNGLWSKYNPVVLELNYFHDNPLESWKVIKEIFYDFFMKVDPNPAHFTLSHLQESGLLQEIITQNIDGLHQHSGSNKVIEFHGTSMQLVCTKCGQKYTQLAHLLENLPPRCEKDNAVLKPDFIFFGEGIPPLAYENSVKAMKQAQTLIIVGTTGEVAPASSLPYIVKQNGGKIIEINTESTSYTDSISDVFLAGKAGEILPEIEKLIIGKM